MKAADSKHTGKAEKGTRVNIRVWIHEALLNSVHFHMSQPEKTDKINFHWQTWSSSLVKGNVHQRAGQAL